MPIGPAAGVRFIVDHCSGEGKRLSNVFIFKFRIFPLKVSTIWIHSECLKHPAQGEAQKC